MRETVERWKITILEKHYPDAWTNNILLNKTKNRVWVWCTSMQAVFLSHYNSQLHVSQSMVGMTISLITYRSLSLLWKSMENVQVSTLVAKLFHLFYFAEHSKKLEPKSFTA